MISYIYIYIRIINFLLFSDFIIQSAELQKIIPIYKPKTFNDTNRTIIKICYYPHLQPLDNKKYVTESNIGQKTSSPNKNISIYFDNNSNFTIFATSN